MVFGLSGILSMLSEPITKANLSRLITIKRLNSFLKSYVPIESASGKVEIKKIDSDYFED